MGLLHWLRNMYVQYSGVRFGSILTFVGWGCWSGCTYVRTEPMPGWIEFQLGMWRDNEGNMFISRERLLSEIRQEIEDEKWREQNESQVAWRREGF